MQKRITLCREHGHFHKGEIVWGRSSWEINLDTDDADTAMTECFQSIKDHCEEGLTSELAGVPVHFDDTTVKMENVNGNVMLKPMFDYTPFQLTYDQCKYVQRYAESLGTTEQKAMESIFKYHAKCVSLGMRMHESSDSMDAPAIENPNQEKLAI